MDSELRRGLMGCETDLEGAMRRFFDDEALYISCLRAFLEDSSLSDIRTALTTRAWDDAFTAAHALKGLAGNMGFVPLYHATGELVLLLRAGRLSELGAAYDQVEQCHHDIVVVIRHSGITQ